MTAEQRGWLGRLVPDVRDYEAPPFALGQELAGLATVDRSRAPGAAVFYCAGILEGLAGDALRRVGEEPDDSLYSNLQVLEQLNRVGPVTLYWAHGLRRLGNVARHRTARVTPDDADLAALFAERWLEWFFRDFSHGPHLPGLTLDGDPLRLCTSDERRSLLEALEALAASPSARPQLAELERNPVFLQSPVLVAVLAEVYLGREEYADAARVLSTGLSRFAEDVRLRQLLGLSYSWTDELEKALEVLEPLYAVRSTEDETAGITAGVYKRLWQKDRSRRDELEKSYRAYRTAWKATGRKVTYLGINAATTALWLGRRDEAAELAGQVQKLLRRRAATLPPELRDPHLAFNYWDQVTLAEAELLLGHRPIARQLYRDAFTRYAHRSAHVKSTRRQLAAVLPSLGLPADVDAFLKRTD